MHNHNAIDLLKTLDENELKRFGDFINSPFFNKKEVVSRLYEIIEKQAPEYKGTSLKKENLYKKLFPGKAYNEQMLRNRMSELNSLIKEFFIITGFQKDDMMQRKCLTKALRKKEKFDLAEKQIKETFQEIEKRNYFNEVYFKDKLEMLYESVKIHSGKDEHTAKLKLSYERIENILNYFFLNLLEVNNDIVLNDIESKIKPEFDFAKHFFDTFDFEKYLSVLKEKNYEHYPLIAIHYYGYLSMIKPEDPGNYETVKKLVFTHYDKFDLMHIYNFWSLLSNCIYVNYITKKDISYAEEGHEVNKFFIEKRLFPADRPFSGQAYQNSIINAILVKDIDWAENFAEEFKKELAADAVVNRYNYCMALICFNKKKYHDSLKHLSFVDNDEWNFKLNTKMYYIRNYYELGLAEHVLSHLDAFRHFRANNPDLIPEYIQENLRETVFYISKIANAKFNGKKLDYAEYKKASLLKTIIHKEWVLEKMKELI